MSASRTSSTTTVPLSNSTARSWADRVSNIFQKDITFHHIDHLPPVSVFGVPKILSFQKPDAYTPQLLALGPYHHLRPELYPMERYKLAAIQSISTPEQRFQFQHLVINRLKELDPLTRACYSKFMDYDEDTLAWIVAIDGCFLLHLWNSYNLGVIDHHSSSSSAASASLLNNSLITRDIMMLENQIPYILLVEIRKFLGIPSMDDNSHDQNCYNDNNNDHDPELFKILMEFCVAHTPIKIPSNVVSYRTESNTRPRHLLDLMYSLIVNTSSCSRREVPIFIDIQQPSIESSSSSSASSSEGDLQMVRGNITAILDTVQQSILGNDKQAGAILKPVQVIANIPWSSISGIFRKGNLPNGDGIKENSSVYDEIAIPSVWFLWYYAGIKCCPIGGERGGLIKEIIFSDEEATLYLPVLNLNATSEVIFRNLVAYEAAMSESSTGLEFARYVNLMNGILDTAADVKLLKQNGVIVRTATVLTDDEIAQLFNGMKRFYVGTSSSEADGDDDRKLSNIDFAISRVNKYYDQKLVVRMRRQIKKRFHASWKSLGILSTILLSALVCLQSFCQVYTCSRFWISK